MPRPPSGPTTTGFGSAVLSLSKSTELRHGDAVEVSGSGFGPTFGQAAPSPLMLWQCDSEGAAACTRATGLLQPDAQGVLRGRAVLTRILIGGGVLVDCAQRPGRCEFGTIAGQIATSAIPMSFVGGAVPPGASIRVEPEVSRNGEQVTFSTSGLPPVGIVSIAQCINAWSVLDAIPLDGISCLTVGAVWQEDLSGSPSRASVRATLARVIPGGSTYSLPEVDCGERPGRCALLLVFNETVVGKTELTFNS